MKKLKYSIHYCSSYAPNFGPENILEDKPHDQSSRWSAETNYPPQYLILKLETPALVKSITFGKFDKTHICNLRKLKVYVGMTESCNLEVLETGLKNDSTPENFDMTGMVDGKCVPCMYVKLAPLLCWGPSFNLSIWYVELSGEDDPALVAPHVEWYRQYEEKEVVKLCLKHFRQRGYSTAFEALTQETGISLEEPAMTELYNLVTAGKYLEVEEYMNKAVTEGRCSDFIQNQAYRPQWVPISDLGSTRPGMRGGHQMCVDPYTESVYLLGGWDGHQDMGDFWVFHSPTSKWTLLSKDTGLEGGPSPRSCHKMVMDHERRQLFVLGRYLDTACRDQVLKSDMYLYDINSNTWTLITDDTGAMGGPHILFDHQMCFDPLQRMLYVFGGRNLTPRFLPAEDGAPSIGVSELRLSGMYQYHVSTNTWRIISGDNALDQMSQDLQPRVGHSMVFHPKHRKLYIFGGQRCKDHLQDLVTYDVDTQETHKQRYGHPDGPAPSAGCTQRATLNPDQDEIYVLSGLSKDKDKRDDNVQYSLWVYSIPKNQWNCIHKYEHMNEQLWNKMQKTEPCPRFAHQFVYDHANKVHYLFGGNPGRQCMPKLRLDDFWKLYLTQPSETQIMRKFQFLIRKHRFEEIALSDRLEALQYLQTGVYEIIDHSDTEQTQEFQSLTSVLFQAADVARFLPRPVASLRDSLFNRLLEFFPDKAVQPKRNLTDILPLCDSRHPA